MSDDPGPSNIILSISLILLLIIVSAFFSMSEMAIITLNDNKIRKMAEEGHPKAKKVLKLIKNPSGFLSTIQIGVTLANLLLSASAATAFSGILTEWLCSVFKIVSPNVISVMGGVATVIITLIISYFTLVLAELVPKRIALQKCEKVSFAVVGALLFVKALTRPIVWFLSASTAVVLKIFGIDPNAENQAVTEEEILMLVDVGEEKGVIEESQKEMINNIFEFDDIAAIDVMTHRTDIEAVEISDSISDVLSIATQKGYSRIPVYEDDIDNILGIIYVKDLLKYVGKSMPKSENLRKFMHKAHFVPESKRCKDLFYEMTEKRVQMVIVSDEYGGTAGIVTLEDLLESIVGNIQDEYDNEQEEIERVDDTTFIFDGVTDIEEVEEELEIGLPEGEYDTLAGMIMSMTGSIPKDGEEVVVEAAGYTFRVEGVTDRRIERVRVEKIPEVSSEEDSGKDSNK